MNAPQSPTESRSALHLQGRLRLSVGQHSVAGRKPQNEDAIGIRIPDGNLLTMKGAAAVVADGVSTAEAGREASNTAVSSFLADYFATPETWSVAQSAQQVLTALNRWLFSQGRGFDDCSKGYITTLSVLILKSRTAHLFHVGDSRIYLLRDGQLEQLTRDHSSRVDDGHSYLARAMGLDTKVQVDYCSHSLREGDLFLQTTDGVHDWLSPSELRSIIAAGKDLQQGCEGLVEKALAAGSNDNLSCQMIRVAKLPDPAVDDVIRQLTELRFPPFLEPGMELDGYRILRELHASTRSQVYQVQDIESGEQFCMKTPSVNFEDDPAYIERFVMESWIGQRIQSPYVVGVVEPPRPKSCLYYLTEFVRGTTLSQWMKEHPRPPVEEAVFLIEQIARGLRALHRRETLHQDIKPDNILIDGQGRVKLVDFGACRVAGIAEIATPLQRDAALGTANYSAPEYRTNRDVDHRADLFSLAVISFEMLTGEAPFGGRLENCQSQRDFLATRYSESYRINPLVPHWIDGALRKSLRYHPERRHADVDEFIYELRHPNPRYLEYHQRPLMERDPLTGWKFIAGILAASQLITLLVLLG